MGRTNYFAQFNGTIFEKTPLIPRAISELFFVEADSQHDSEYRQLTESTMTTYMTSESSRDLPPAVRQAILIRAHVDAMREKLECSQLYVEESRRNLRNIEMPRPL